MRKILNALLYALLCGVFWVGSCHAATISIDAFTTPDDVTVTHLETMRATLQTAVNSIDGTLIQDDSIDEDAMADSVNPVKRWDEAFNDFVYSGLTIPTSASLSSTTTSGTAYIEGKRVLKDETTKAYTASKHTYIDLSSNGTYTYTEVAINASSPSVAANSIRLARVSTDASSVLSVVDQRVTSPTLLKSFVGTTTFAATESGTLSITGFGLKPVRVAIVAVVDTTRAQSYGVTDCTNEWVIADIEAGGQNYYELHTGRFIHVDTAATDNIARSTLTSCDADGITINRTKTNSPTGTVTLLIDAMR